jgi:hypothetical protein
MSRATCYATLHSTGTSGMYRPNFTAHALSSAVQSHAGTGLLHIGNTTGARSATAHAGELAFDFPYQHVRIETAEGTDPNTGMLFPHTHHIKPPCFCAIEHA